MSTACVSLNPADLFFNIDLKNYQLYWQKLVILISIILLFMTKNIFIASAEPYTGKSVIAFGMINMLLAKTQKVGYFKPIIALEDPNKRDEHVEAMLDYFSLPIRYEDAFAFTRQDMLHQAEDSGTIINT
ncbi:MAG: phosphate acetyltransferase, partial [Pedobacter sp.]